MKKIARFACGLLALSGCADSAFSESLPLWEVGAGVAVINLPDYRGSPRRQTYVLPLPYVAYRGDILKIDHSSVRGRLFNSRDVELDLSLNGSVPVKSRDNPARQGMPDLDPTFELGPALNVTMMRSHDEKMKLDLRLPVRPVFATDFNRVGTLAQPQLNLDVIDPFGQHGWKLGLAAGLLYADQRYAQHFYAVDAAYATATRPAFDARGGYAGSQFTASLSKRFPRVWVGGFLRWDDLHGAAFQDSPLVKHKQFFTGGFAVAWIFRESTVRVDAKE